MQKNIVTLQDTLFRNILYFVTGHMSKSQQFKSNENSVVLPFLCTSPTQEFLQQETLKQSSPHMCVVTTSKVL